MKHLHFISMEIVHTFFKIFYNYLVGADSKFALFFKDNPIPKVYFGLIFSPLCCLFNAW